MPKVHGVEIESAAIVVYGNPGDGFRFVGPFEGMEQAIAYMEDERSKDNMWACELDHPESA
jgi:hypothetical protein